MIASAVPNPYARGSSSFASKLGALGVGVFAITIWALPQYLFPIIGPARVGVVTAGLMAAGLAGRWILGGAAPTAGGWRVLGLGAFAGAAALSPLWSVDPASSQWAAGEALKMGLVFVSAASLLDTPTRVRNVAWAIALAGCVPAYYAVSNSLAGVDLLEGYRARWVGTFFDPNRLAMALVISAMLLLTLRSRLRNPVARAAVLGLLGLQLWAIVVTYSRGAILGLAVGLLAFILAGRGSRTRSILVAGGVAIALLSLAPSRFWARTETIATYEQDLSAQGRIDAWRTAGNILSRRPLTGIGAAAFTTAWATYAPDDAGRHPYVAHNLFLEVAAELGIPTLVAFLALLAACIRGAWWATEERSPVRLEARGLLASIAGYLVCQMFAGFTLSFFLFLVLGIATASERLARFEREARERPIELQPNVGIL
ncbi:O-antigen ligase family protein [Vulgatibacter incomptus]|uniref:Putative membrane protein of ExoQ family, involved in exopolysaccharide production n=1 Tax=Vulgatibacter incomptus TaxID=1391653 RepID=A0A0K1PCN2_9BACT|nr:O-antigen ligase family protein [Vulgatibacter incomptus]AKU91293.1 Putative membrane protein of ExoQ family, involved in exopolysaccharide production [Vulgatibacter incomptus]